MSAKLARPVPSAKQARRMCCWCADAHVIPTHGPPDPLGLPRVGAAAATTRIDRLVAKKKRLLA